MLSKFFKKFAPEYKELGGALVTIASGLALRPEDRAKVIGAAELIESAADNIANSIKDVEKFEKAGVSRDLVKEVLKELVSEMLPDMIAGIIEKQTRKVAKNTQEKE